jgi:L-amino acid N-acyltransferase
MIRECCEDDLAGVLEIYNDAVQSTTAIWNDTVVDLANRRAWLQERTLQGYPVLCAVESARVLGYATFGMWRAFDGYRHTVEHSIYVHRNARRTGVATSLMQALLRRAREQGKHAMIGAVEASNQASLAFHARFGFAQVAYMPEVGIKFGRWLDLILVQLVLAESTARQA